MAAPILEVDPERPNPRHLERAVAVLREGGLVAYPTDTYYGVGCALASKKGIDRLYELKMMTRQKQVGIRIPDALIARELPRMLGVPVVTTSATNPDGEPLIDARDIKDVLGHGLDLILDGGIQPSEPSTVVMLHADRLEILRQGKGEL
jgi:tRNA A37 threonylcarbamoyladenosine synthetase subunit TsaC/SUA5/YrdC